MYDSVVPSQIPSSAQIVAGYIDGLYAWSGNEWALFPNAYKLRITIDASLDDGRVLDVETGDATPAQAPHWVNLRRQSIAHPLSGPACVYTSLYNWPAVKAAFAAQNVAPPDYWIAAYDGVAVVPEGAVAKQYQSITGKYDISVTLGNWPGVPTPSSLEAEMFVTTNPGNNGKVILNPATGTWYGLSEPAVYTYYTQTLGIPEKPAPSAEVFSHFNQGGTI